MVEPCNNCIYDGDNIIRCKDCKRAGGIYTHYKPKEIEHIVADATPKEDTQQKSVVTQKKKKRSKK